MLSILPFKKSKCFSYSFPYGYGDVTMKDRPRNVTLTDATKHLLWYCVTSRDGMFSYPCVEDERWMY